MSNELVNNIGVRIYEIRKAKRMDQEAFGQSIGVGRTTVLNWESGDVDPMKKGKKNLQLLCKVHGVSEQYLFDGIGEMFIEEKPKEASIIDNFLLKQIELKDNTIATLQATVNHLLGMPGKLNVLESAEAPIKPMWPEGTFSGTSLVA
jgi:transcriptional regulator with XRE-family HTH domain